MRAQPTGSDSEPSDASSNLRANRLNTQHPPAAENRLVRAARTEPGHPILSEHVGAGPAGVRIRETVQRGRSHPMDAGELVRFRRGVTRVRPLDASLAAHHRVHMQLPFSQGLNPPYPIIPAPPASSANCRPRFLNELFSEGLVHRSTPRPP